MFTLIGKLISAALDNFFNPYEEPKYELEDCVVAAEDATDCTENEEPILGEITHLNPIRQYGIINEEHYFRLSLAPGEHLTVSTKVLFRLHATSRQVRELSVLPEPPPSSIVAKVTKLGDHCLHLLDVARPVQLSAGYEPDFEVCSGDWVRLHLDKVTGSATAVEALRSKHIIGQVTRLTSTGGIIEQQIAFSTDQWPTDAARLKAGLQVAVHAIESDQGSLAWRAVSLEVYDEKAVPSSPSCHNGIIASKLCHIPDGLDVPKEVDFGEISPGESHSLQLCITNATDRPHLLVSCKFNSAAKQVALAKAFQPYLIASGDKYNLDLVCKASELGTSNEKIELEFEEGFFIQCVATVRVVDPLEAKLAPSSKASSVKKLQTISRAFQEQLWTVPGERCPMRQAKLPEGLPHFPVNPAFWKMTTRELERFVSGLLRQPLCPENYVEKLQLLLHLEEVQLSRDLEERVLCPAPLRIDGCLARLNLSSWLEEAQFPPRVGDRVLLQPADAPSVQLNFEGFVHQVMSDEAILRVSPAFHEEMVKNPGQTWELRFQLNRTPLRRCHLAVRISRPLIRSLLFPKKQPQTVTRKWPLKLVNEQLNELQQEAVNRIMVASKCSLPYVVWGPPGTGKTVTLVEAILQVFLNIEHSRVIACAPSNSAADLLAEKLWTSGKLVSSDIVRLLGFQRDVDAVPPRIKHICVNTGNLKKAARHRIVVATVATAGALYGLGLPPDHFTHGFLDEAGQATEPETLVVMGLVCLAGGSLILGGDPMQLGPVVRSRLAVKGGLGESLLHRLLLGSSGMSQPKQLNCLPLTRLRNSYRCTQSLLEPYSKLFYDSQLLSCVGKQDRGALPDFPVFFHGVRGCAQKEGSCPSWFNPSEVVQVTRYLQRAFGPWGLLPEQVGVVTPYRKQAQKLRCLMDSLDLPHCKLGSAEEFQGQERSLIIVSTVRGSEAMSANSSIQNLDFIFCARRFNVAISRASAMLVVVGNPDVLTLDANWKSLMDYCSSHKTCYGLAAEPVETPR
ncbi:putative helicase MOV-10 isoform X2 [Dermacentor silvarum]|uniref:putative helicase MOV-10 isoform X2 n=1 Tax=Dermacentor silvarum TaxID=543639 RepID=UPI001896E73A|nr:putative helicase MOV-10 isoform X2 [Dermacentor silvarum]